MIVFDMILLNQNVPTVLKKLLVVYHQQNCVPGILSCVVITDYQNSKPVYFGAWLVSAGCASSFPRLNCTSKEADDRMMFHVQDILSHWSGPTSMTRSLGDTDVFVCVILYYSQLEGSWPPRALAHL